MLAPYAGSKSFLASFTTSLGEELQGKGIDVECSNTYFVVRPFFALIHTRALSWTVCRVIIFF